MAEQTIKKLSELTTATDLSGAYTLAVDKNNEGGKVSFATIGEYARNSTISDIYIAYPYDDTTRLPMLRYTKVGESVPTIRGFQRASETVAGILVPEDFKRFDEAASQSKQKLFDELWLAATTGASTPYEGVVDHTRGGDDYGVNGVWMTYEEAKVAYNNRRLNGPYGYMVWQYCKQKTNIPIPGPTYIKGISHMFSWSSQLEVARLNNANLSKSAEDGGAQAAFRGCSGLRRIIGYICPTFSGASFSSAFAGCSALEDVEIKMNLYKVASISFADSPKLSLASLQYLVTNAKNDTTQCVVTVHADVYARLTGTDAAWAKVLADGAAKNITFAKG